MNLKQVLRHSLDPQELDLLVRSYDVVGDIAIIALPPALLHRETLIGEAIMSINKRIKVVARRDGCCSGEYRITPLKIVAGEQRLETIHREFGVLLQLDLGRVYFSPRSGNERKRLADMVVDDESILVMFSGIAPAPLLLAKHSPAATIIGVEKNSDAHHFALINRKKNRAEKKVSLWCGDVVDLVPSCGMKFDRIVMPLPGSARSFLHLAIHALHCGGHLHLYDFQPQSQFAETVAALQLASGQAGRTMRLDNVVVCGHNSPSSYRICVDASIF